MRSPGFADVAADRLVPLRARLLQGRQLDQVAIARETYLAVPDDDILHGFRVRAGQAAPGRPMGGWCGTTSEVIFGQLLSGLASLGHALGEAALTAKAIRLFEGWRATVGDDGDARMGTYGWDKLVGGIVDLARYAGHRDGLDWLARSVAWAGRAFPRERAAAGALDWDGRGASGALEWYTLGENLLRAWATTGDPEQRAFAEVWRYPAFWERFATTARPGDAPVVHAYSHVNSLASLACAARVDGDAALGRAFVNAADWVLATQCYATGGFGPWERLLPPGGLGRALDACCDHAELGCGSWAGLKLVAYLLAMTGDARWADWSERLVYNAVGASLPVRADGRTQYYADYRPSGAAKAYCDAAWPCCSGTWLQAIAAYHDCAWLAADDGALHVALYLPSEVEHRVGASTLRWRLETAFPADDVIRLRCAAATPTAATLRLRRPTWCADARLLVAGEAAAAEADPRGWIAITRTWRDGDEVVLTLVRAPWLQPVDAAQPGRCALLLGPVVLAQDARYGKPFARRHADDLGRLEAGDAPLRLRVRDHRASDLPVAGFRALADVPERHPHRVYHDLDRPFLY